MAKKKDNNWLIIGAIGLFVILGIVLYMRGGTGVGQPIRSAYYSDTGFGYSPTPPPVYTTPTPSISGPTYSVGPEPTATTGVSTAGVSWEATAERLQLGIDANSDRIEAIGVMLKNAQADVGTNAAGWFEEEYCCRAKFQETMELVCNAVKEEDKCKEDTRGECEWRKC